MARRLLFPAFLVVVTSACTDMTPQEAEHPCQAENHCVRDGSESLCEQGFEWQDPSDEDNYTCVAIGEGTSEEAPSVFEWTLPSGGDPSSGFWQVAGGSFDVGSHQWTLLDINGDERPDLVITARTVSTADGDSKVGFGFPSDPHWLVHENTGTGFASSARRISLPSGGDPSSGFWQTSGGSFDVGSDQWTLMDMTGDKRPDLVITARTKTTADGDSKVGLGFPGNPHWRVLVNRGDRFGD